MTRDAALTAFLDAIRIPRERILEAKQYPTGEPEDGKIPQLGFIGPRYEPGGVLLLAINPGGGGDSYKRPWYDAHLPTLAECQSGEAGRADLEEVFTLIRQQLPQWRFWGIVEPTLAACRKELDEIAFLNWCPFRTRMDKMPSAIAMRRSFDLILGPMVTALQPGVVIAMGKKVGNWVTRYDWGGRVVFVVPRTVGDSYLSREAIDVLKYINERIS